MIIKQLDYNEYKGKRYRSEIYSDRFLSIEPEDDGFTIKWVDPDGPLLKFLEDEMFSEWLDHPVAYGCFDDGELIGFAEGFLEKWNDRYRISNICILRPDERGKGIGTQLLEKMLDEAALNGARMVVLETQSYNSKAISFYQKNGFEIIGFDRYAYSNNGPEEHNMRIEMGKKL